MVEVGEVCDHPSRPTWVIG